MDVRLLQKMMADIRKNKKIIEDKMKSLEDTEFSVSSGGGLIEVVMNGKYEVVRCTLDDKAMVDKETLQDLFISAMTEVVKKVNDEMKRVQSEFLPKGGMF